MSRKQNMSGVWKFLEMSGVLDTGSEIDIEKKRKEYWNARKRMSKQEKRKQETEFEIYLNRVELLTIASAAMENNMSRTRYIKQAALAYANRQYILPDKAEVNHIKQLLALNYSLLQEMAETMPFDLADTLLQQMGYLEQQVTTALCNPKIKPSSP
jgi:hypothetical protein